LTNFFGKVSFIFFLDLSILKVNSKILILHAEDDWFVPSDRSRELVQICEEKRPKSYPPVKLVEFHKGLELGHAKIYTHKKLYPLIK
jgi:hypothetical protein